MILRVDRLIRNEETKSLSLYITEMIAELEDKLFLKLESKNKYSDFLNFRKNCRWIIGEAVWHMMKAEPAYSIYCYDIIKQTISDIPYIIQTDVRKMNPFEIRLEYEKKDPAPQFRYDLCCTSKYLEPYIRVGNDSLKIGKVTDIDFCDDGVKLKTNITNNWLFQEVIMLKKIKRVVFNNPATIIIWEDGTKTVVKAENEPYDPEKGLAMCLAKKSLGNKGNYYDVFKKWLPKEEK